jgi:hypothetical protein
MRFVFLALALLMFFIWLGAFVVFHIAVAIIHVLLVLAIVFFVIHLMGRIRTKRKNTGHT